MSQLKLTDVRKELTIKHINRGHTIHTVQRFINQESGFKFDFDVWLPTKNMNLQRPLVWTELQKSEFIISVLKGIFIPPLSVVKLDDKEHRGHYQVIDGKQRMNTAFSFCRGEFPIIWNGAKYYFDDLDKAAQSRIGGDYYLRFDIAYHYEDEPITDQQKIDWFELINFSGTPQDVEHLNKLKQ